MPDPFELLFYRTNTGSVPFREWLDTVSDPIGFSAVQGRLDRLERGLFGDCRQVGNGVWELRVDTGPGYRAYYALAGKHVVLLLCGGKKRSQTADIRTAKAYWSDYEQRTNVRSRTR